MKINQEICRAEQMLLEFQNSKRIKLHRGVLLIKFPFQLPIWIILHDLQKMFVRRSPFHIAGIITIVEFHGIFFKKRLTTFGKVIPE